MTSKPESIFYVKNCSLASIATGEKASSLLELRDKLMVADEGCIYHHFWGARMSPELGHPQNHNDFASWVFDRLHDHILAERLSIIDPTEFNNLEELKQELLEVIEKRLDDYELIFWTKKEDSFHFISSIIIIFESMFTLSHPEEMQNILPKLPLSSIFYHFIDARKRTVEKKDDFSVWMKQFGSQYDTLVDKIQAIDPYFLSLSQLKEELISVVQNHFKSED